jgi:hypothetical protein
VQAVIQEGARVGEDNERLNRAELLQLHQQYASEIRTSLDFVNRNLSFYVGLMSAILGILLAALLNVDSGNRRALWLLIGPGLVIWLAELGCSTVRAFYHRFIDATFTLFNIEHMLRFDDPHWITTGISNPLVPSTYGGFIAQWAGAIDWLKDHQTLTLEAAKQAFLECQPATLIDKFRQRRVGAGSAGAVTLIDARTTMWAFELASLLLAAALVVTAF